MAGISSQAAGKLENLKKYNGNELQHKEFSDLSGLEWTDFNARTYDQQTGRFIQIDPLIESGDQERLTPYQFSYNNPVRFNDPDGKCPMCIPLIPYVAEALYAGGVAVVAYFTAKAAAPIIEQAAQNAGKALRNAPETNIVMGGPLMMGTASYTPTTNTASTATTKEKTHETYQKPALDGSAPYSGKTSGTGTPEQNVAKRDKNHHMNDTHGPAEVDKSSTSSDAVRGREQQLIENSGGAKSGGGTSGNQNNGIAPTNPKKDQYLEAAKKIFGGGY